MPKWWSVVMVWLVALALPVQGLAAATMLHCEPVHVHTQPQPASPSPSPSPSHLASHAQGHLHGAEMADHHHAAADTPAAAAKAGKCSACASCCSACALPSAMPSVPQPDVAATVFTAVVRSIDPFVASGPDRPPRSVLA